MKIDRRVFLRVAGGGIIAGSLHLPPARAEGKPQYRAVAFDAFPIFDPRPILSLTEGLFPGRGAELGNAWRARQFEYQWLRSLSGRYEDFRRTTDDALRFAARSLQLELPNQTRERLLQGFDKLTVWPDVPRALEALKGAGVRLAFLSNMTDAMLNSGVEASGLQGVFERILSTDQIKRYKPDPKAYEMATDALGLKREEILFAAFAGWDVAGAKWFGYPTFWVNRLGAPPEELGPLADGMGRGLDDLVRFVTSSA